MADDPELRAMTAVLASLSDLDGAAQARVIDWAAKRLGVTAGQARKGVSVTHRGDGNGDGADSSQIEREHVDFVDLYDATTPGTDAERALVGGYWFQQELRNSSFNSQQVNNVLKDVGHGVTNITRALDDLQQRSPALVRQMAKSGRTKQARKTYKLTSAGIRAVGDMVTGAEE